MKKIIYIAIFTTIITAGAWVFSKNIPPETPVNEGAQSENSLSAPMDRVDERITKKPFGKYVHPQDSPVNPERFTGYHTAIDLEAFPEEAEKDVPVKAICSGPLLQKHQASGYGGVAVQACRIQNEPITVIYGHLALSSIKTKKGEELKKGEEIGLLGAGFSPDTDNERKHLHLGIHKGEEINILGYVQSQQNLSDWIDPCLYFCGR